MNTPNIPIPSLDPVLKTAATIILGKETAIKLAVACLLARGHLLIEDIPGVGKTTLAHALARLLGLEFSRIQFTSDLLPADITGVSIFNREKGVFQFLPGPIFAQLVLADEINRATPKAQSALLEAMEEKQITADGDTYRLPEPFFVIATQNPAQQIGTFLLPESQLDRFLMRIELGYPDPVAERNLLATGGKRERINEIRAELTPAQVMALQKQVTTVHVSSALLDYIQALVGASRRFPEFRHGLSPRAALALLAAGRAWAFVDKRNLVLPEDIQTVFSSVARHRLLTPQGNMASEEMVTTLLHSVPV